MARFTDLPNELLLDILDYVQATVSAQRTISSLCLVSRHFVAVAQTYLYRAPKAFWLTHDDIWKFTILLVRSLLYNPDLRLKVLCLDLHFIDHTGEDFIPVNGDEFLPMEMMGDMYIELRNQLVETKHWERSLRNRHLNAWIALLLLLTSELESLELSTGASARHDYGYGHHDLERGLFRSFENAHDFTLSDAEMLQSLKTLRLYEVQPHMMWCSLPALHTLELDAKLNLPEMRDSGVTLNMTCLILHHHAALFYDWPANTYHGIYAERIEHFLEACERLKDLRLYFMDSGSSSSYLEEVEEGSYQSLIQRLIPVSSTLQHLDLTSPVRYIPLTRTWLKDAAPIDSLRHFTSLESLFAFQETLDLHTGIAIPTSLEHLRIQRPTLDWVASLYVSLQNHWFDEVNLHYENDSDLPSPYELYHSSQRADLQRVGIRVPITWSQIDNDPSWFGVEDQTRVRRLDHGMMSIN